MIAIRIENLKKIYKSGFFKKKSFEALKGISVEIKEGEIFGFLGPNGAGKTTTILAMLNLIKKDEGKILIFEKELLKNPDLFEKIGYVPEEPYLYNFLKVEEFIRYGVKLSKYAQEKLNEKIERFLKLFDLWEKRNSLIKNLSKGQKQRVLLALNFLIEPDLLILDEPFRGLDPVGIKNVRDQILELSKKGKTVFLSSHLISEIEMVCNRVSIINDGLIIWEGQPSEISKDQKGYIIKFKGDEKLFEMKVRGQEELLTKLKEINEKNYEILEVKKEKGLEEHFLEKIKRN